MRRRNSRASVLSVRTSGGPCLAPVVLSFKLIEHRGEDWHELTHQIRRAVNSKGKCDNCGHLMTAEMLRKFFS